MRARTSVLVALLLAALTTPAAIAVTDPGGLDEARGELEAASRDLEEIRTTVRRVDAEVRAIDERLRAASTDLAQVRQQLDQAETAAEAAAQAERRAAGVLQEATAELEGLVVAHTSSRDALSDRAIRTYKRGGSLTPDLAFSGILRASDLHEVAVTREAVTRLMRDQRDLITDTGDLTRATAAAHAEVAAARREAIVTARTAAEERARVARLVTRQERLVTTVESEAATRRAVLDRLERDAAARAVLVRDLEARVTELELSAAAARVPVVHLDPDAPAPAWASGLPAAGRPWAATIDRVARSQGLDGRLLAALVWTESNFRPDAVSHAGAIGLAQLMPGTARGLGVDPWDPVANLRGGARYLAQQLDRFGRLDLGLAAYNAGPGRVQQAGNQVPNIVETQLYVVRVLERFERLRALG